ncbi:MAG: HAD-IA family hydrolase, partial [Deltaproteobacteria bacterium]|nr:HAD-IA family hydrolase [Deltaproteobacteria bacterium]
MKKISLLIFDLDGTLIDSKADITNCVLWTLRDMGLPSIPDEVIHSYVGNGVRPLIQKSVEAAHGSSFDKAIRIFEGYYRSHLIDKTRPFPGVQETLEHFRSKKMAVCTNKPQYFTEPILSGLKLDHYFMTVIGSGNTFPKKPDPTMIFHLIKEGGCRPEEVVLIGDSRVDI